MEDKFNNTNYTSRIEKRKIEEEVTKKKLEREKELEEKRAELKKVLFDKSKPTKNKSNKPILANLLLSFTLVVTILLTIFLVLDSSNRVNQLYEIINAFLILFIVISLLISFKKSFYKSKSGAMVFSSILILIAFTFNVLYISKIITLPTQSHISNFENKPLTKAIEWAEENNISNSETFEYSDNVDKYSVISQSEKENTLTKNIDNIKYVVSNGPDYSKTVILTDMSGKEVDSVLEFVNKNHLSNVSIVFEESDVVSRNTVIKQSTTGQIKRSDSIIFTISLGNKSSLSPIKLKDLTNEDLLNASVYLSQNGIIYELKYEFSDKIYKGKVISSDVKKGTSLKADDKVILTISKGKEITIPNFKNKKASYITKWMIENNVQINYLEKYDNTIKSGRVIESNYKKGDIIEEDTIIDITFSKGKLKMKSFTNIDDFKNWASENNIKYEIKEEFNNQIEKNKIIKTSIKEGKVIKDTDTITVYVSKGEAVTVPDFSNKTKSEVQKECNSLGLTCSFTEEYSTSVSSGKVISQSISKNTEISKGDSISIVIATTNKTATKKTTNSNSNRSNSSSNNSSNNNGSTTQLKTYNNVTLSVAWYNTSTDSNTTCSKIRQGIQSQTSSKVIITCKNQPTNDARKTGKIHEDSLYQGNGTYSFTEGITYEIIIVE